MVKIRDKDWLAQQFPKKQEIKEPVKEIIKEVVVQPDNLDEFRERLAALENKPKLPVVATIQRDKAGKMTSIIIREQI